MKDTPSRFRVELVVAPLSPPWLHACMCGVPGGLEGGIKYQTQSEEGV